MACWGLVAQTPAGGAIDATNRKRGAVVFALAVLAVSAVVIFAAPTFWPVLVSNTVIAIVGDIFGPAVAALTLGLYARNQLARRMGRNSAFDHAGNVAIAAAAGAVGYLLSQRAVFLLVPVFALLAIVATLAIPHGAIDQNRGTRPRRKHSGTGSGRVGVFDVAEVATAGSFRALRNAVPFLRMRRCFRWWGRSWRSRIRIGLRR